MDLVGREILEAFKTKHADARPAIERWERLVTAAAWRNFADLRRTLASADQVKLDRELVVTVFDVDGNNYRLISEVAYTVGIVRALAIMTHAEYDKGRWKRDLTR